MSLFSKNELSEKGFNVEEIYDQILLISDFISEEEVSEVFDIINNIKEEDWSIEYLSNIKKFCMEKFGRDDVENLVAEGKFEITKNWEDKNFNINGYSIQKIMFDRLNNMIEEKYNNLILSGFVTLQRMQHGVELKSHTDQHTDPSIKYATILYLNDDYVDGKVFFKNIDLELKPKKGSLLMFPGDEHYEHGVHPVGEGPIRYVLVGFVKIKDFYNSGEGIKYKETGAMA